MLKKVAGILVAFGLVSVTAESQQADSLFLPRDGIVFSLQTFAPLSDDMQETYGFIPSLGVRAMFESARQISIVCGGSFLYKAGEFYSSWGPMLRGEPTRLRAALGEFGLRMSSIPRAKRNVFMEGGVSLAWAGERFREADTEIFEKEHSGTGMGLWLGGGTERFVRESLSWGLQGRVSLCSVTARYDRYPDYWPSSYSIDLSGVWISVFLGLYR